MMDSKLELFTTSKCTRCVKLSSYLEEQGIEFVKRVMDKDPEAKTDAIMFRIMAAPALRKGNTVLKSKDLFDKDDIRIENMKDIIGA